MITNPHRIQRLKCLVLTATVMLLAFMLQACVDVTVHSYESLTYDLDGRNELHISTYPAGFPRETSSIPFLYKAVSTPDSVYFQLYVRDQQKKSGPNPNIDSIHIRSFSYYFPGQEPVTLVSDYDEYFWMQDNPQQNPAKSPPAPYDEHWYLYVRVDMTINGKDYLVDEKLMAKKEQYRRSLLGWAMQ
ncbi:MAG TPA: hypothetical protein VFG52_09560 [Xanthomonadales bacterium]|nr:hypothetical protein [Xanthomonadales bacterium]